ASPERPAMWSVRMWWSAPSGSTHFGRESARCASKRDIQRTHHKRQEGIHAMTTATFAIGGMHCAACAVRNERTLRKIPGVREASVNLGTRRARVEFDETAVSEADLREAIVESGYEVLADEAGDHRQQAREELQTARRRALLAIVLAAPVTLLAMSDIT